jgi:hypothetical protein
MSLDDLRWAQLRSAYGVPYDPRPALAKLARRVDDETAWDELWGQLYHQGGIGDAAYGAVPELVRIHRGRGAADWRTYALVATIDLSRESPGNPAVPDWLRTPYMEALSDLGKLGAAEVLSARGESAVQSILAVLAIHAGARTYARILIVYELNELIEMEDLWKSRRP